MTEILLLVLLTSIWIWGVKIATSEDMVLENLGTWGEKKVNEGHKIFEPLLTCEWCMPSIHSLVGYAFAFGLGIIPFEFEWRLVIEYPLVVIGSSIVTGNTWNLYKTINAVRERAEAEKEKAKIQSKYYAHIESLAFFDLKERKEHHHKTNKKQQHAER